MVAHQATRRGDLRRRAEGFHVVDDGGLAQIAFFHRKGRPDAWCAAFAFQGFDQGALLAPQT